MEGKFKILNPRDWFEAYVFPVQDQVCRFTREASLGSKQEIYYYMPKTLDYGLPMCSESSWLFGFTDSGEEDAMAGMLWCEWW